MQRQIDQLSQNQSQVEEAHSFMLKLNDSGLIRQDVNGSWNPVKSLEEQKLLLS